MSAESTPDFIFAGPSKAGSSWLSEALREHPEIFLPDLKPVNFFNLKYHLGMSWYRSVFAEAGPNQVVGDASPGYIISDRAPARIAEQLDDIRVLFTLRNPIDRAFSHWWHDTTGGGINYDFEDLLFVDQLFEVYIRMGMYVDHIQRWQRHLPEEQIKVLLFDDFVEDNGAFVEDVYDFIGADSSYKPSIVGERVNEAQRRGPGPYDRLKDWVAHEGPAWIRGAVSPVYPVLRSIFESKSEYEKGMDPVYRKELELVYAQPTKELSDLIDRDLNHWFDHIDLEKGEYRSQVQFPEEYKSAYRHWESNRVISKSFQKDRGAANTRR